MTIALNFYIMGVEVKDMPFPMVHFIIAHGLEINKKIIDFSQYYIGILAPDAYTHRKTYSFIDRNASHLFADDLVCWQNNVLNFVEKHKYNNHKCLYLGYAIHILTDIFWEDMIYKPFRFLYAQKNKKEKVLFSDSRELYLENMTMIDLWLYRNCEFKNILWEYLSQGGYIDVYDLISKLLDELG
jgi:hypothetical protein